MVAYKMDFFRSSEILLLPRVDVCLVMVGDWVVAPGLCIGCPLH
uniref:Uncharacterized protein n=1 Tax=Anguilla anguilla TaxID=7936 RepID=A0A0E9Y1U8_ANGAN